MNNKAIFISFTAQTLLRKSIYHSSMQDFHLTNMNWLFLNQNLKLSSVDQNICTCIVQNRIKSRLKLPNLPPLGYYVIVLLVKKNFTITSLFYSSISLLRKWQKEIISRCCWNALAGEKGVLLRTNLKCINVYLKAQSEMTFLLFSGTRKVKSIVTELYSYVEEKVAKIEIITWGILKCFFYVTSSREIECNKCIWSPTQK